MTLPFNPRNINFFLGRTPRSGSSSNLETSRIFGEALSLKSFEILLASEVLTGSNLAVLWQTSTVNLCELLSVLYLLTPTNLKDYLALLEGRWHGVSSDLRN